MTRRIYSGATPAQVARDLAPLVAFADPGMGEEDFAALVKQRLLPHLMHYDSPTFQSMFNAAPEAGARWGAEVALAHNQGVTNWQVSPGGAVLEEVTCRALCDLFGLAPGADATFMYSGTYANQQAVYLALHRHAQALGFDLAREGVAGFAGHPRPVLLVSADAHFSLRHAVRLLGLGDGALIPVAVDANRRMDPAALEAAAARVRGERSIFAVVATAGTTSTGAVDPLGPAADLCRELHAWLHVDGAYGLAYALLPRWAPLFAGMERADSITWDPHKQLGVPIPSSLLFVRDGADFRRMALHSGYFNRAEDPEPNPGLKSPPSTRPMAALPLVASLRRRGMAGVRADLTAHVQSIRELAAELQADPRRPISLCHWPDTGILCFRVTPPGWPAATVDDLQSFIYRRILTEGRRAISLTTLDGRPALRLVVVSPHVTLAHLRESVDAALAVAREWDGRGGYSTGANQETP